jgi:CPA2 family monovalent cation:H+ antiporter-2
MGEFSFIVGQAGLSLGLITGDQYSLILAAAIVSITINPVMFRMIFPAERMLQRVPWLWRLLNLRGEALPMPARSLSGHVVIVGSGRVGRHISEVVTQLGVSRLVVEIDASRIEKLRSIGVPVLYGDAGNSEILAHAGLDRARALVLTLADDVASVAAVMLARSQAPNLRIIARASSWDGARRLRAAGANHIVRPELEGGIEIVRMTLLDLELPMEDIARYTDLVRQEELAEHDRPSPERARLLHDLVQAAHHVEVRWFSVDPGSSIAGQTLGESDIRARTGISVVAIVREGVLSGNPGPTDRLLPGDRVAVIGAPDQIPAAEQLFEAVQRT